jgi:regulator of protease activity HflC (stomatin/prohibitin superfamily)
MGQNVGSRDNQGRVVVTRKHVVGIVLGILFIVFLCLLGKIGEDVKTEQIVVNQRPFSGRMEYWTEPGFRWQMFGRTTHYFKTQQLWFGADNQDGHQVGEPIPVIFNDASDGLVYGSLRVKLPTDVQHIQRIQTDYTGMERLMNDLVKQTVVKVVYASGPLMSGFESYGERKNDLIEYFTDQLMNGVYKTTINIEETVDQFTGETKIIKVAARIPDPNSPGGFKRSESSPFSYYGIEISQVSVSRIAYSETVQKQIAKQQEKNMDIRTKQAEALAAQQDAIKAEAEGKAAAAKAKWAQETIKATEVTKAEQEREVARLAAERAKFEKERIIAEGQAEAEANRLKVAAGLTPQERAEWDYKTAVGIAEALANSKVQWVPQIMMSGGDSKGSGNSAMDAVGLSMMLEVVKKLNENKK